MLKKASYRLQLLLAVTILVASLVNLSSSSSAASVASVAGVKLANVEMTQKNATEPNELSANAKSNDENNNNNNVHNEDDDDDNDENDNEEEDDGNDNNNNNETGNETESDDRDEDVSEINTETDGLLEDSDIEYDGSLLSTTTITDGSTATATVATNDSSAASKHDDREPAALPKRRLMPPVPPTFTEPVRNSSTLLQLRRSLLLFYDRSSKPQTNATKRMLVQMGVSVVQINNLDEVYQVMTSTLQISLRWRDEFIRWNESQYEHAISFQSHEIWVPDVLAINSVSNFKYENKERYLSGYANNIFDNNERNKYFIMVQPNGDCRWVFPLKVLSICQLNQDFFPFDIQQCNIDFGSSAYPAEQLQVEKFKNGVNLQIIVDSEFDLIKTQADEIEIFRTIVDDATAREPDGDDSECQGVDNRNTTTSSAAAAINITNVLCRSRRVTPLQLMRGSPVLRITLLMKRKIIFYFNKIILPYFVFYIVTIFTYLLPVESGEKKSYITSILLSGMIYLKDISYYIPKTSVLPILSIYFNLNFIYVFVCLILSTVIYALYYLDKTKRPLPRCLQRFVLKSKYSIYDKLLKEAFLNLRRTSTRSAVNFSQIKLEIRNELKNVNDELSNLSQSCANSMPNTPMKMLKDRRPQRSLHRTLPPQPLSVKSLASSNCFGQSLDVLGQDTLDLLRTLKLLILKHNKHQHVNSDYSNNLNEMFRFCTGLNIPLPAGTAGANVSPSAYLQTDVETPIFYNKKSMSNFHFINTLENLKMQISKAGKRKPTRPEQRHGEHAGKNTPIIESYSSSSNASWQQQQQQSSSRQPRGHLYRQHIQQSQEKQYSAGVNADSLSPTGPKQERSEVKKAKYFLFLLKSYKSQINAYLCRFKSHSYAAANKLEFVFYQDKFVHKQIIDRAANSPINRAFARRHAPDYTYQWKYLAMLFDRIVFYFFALIMPVSILIMSFKTIILH